MDEMLKTWKEPVPGSMDTRPVFPPEVTRPIENALIKARTSALHLEQQRSQQQGYGRGRLMTAPYRNTPTPPGACRLPQHQAPPVYTTGYSQPTNPPPVVTQPAYPLGVNQQLRLDVNQQPSVPTPAYPPTHEQYPPDGQPYPINTQHYLPSSQQFQPISQQYPTSMQHYPPPSNEQPYLHNSQPTLPVNVQQYPPSNGQPYVNYVNGHQPQGLPQVGVPLPSHHVCKLMNKKRPPSRQYSHSLTVAPSWQPPAQGYDASESIVDILKNDISDLIASSKAHFANNPWNSSIQTRLKALLDLQTILSSQQLPPDQITLIKNQVAQLYEAAHSSTPHVAPLISTSPPATAVVAQLPGQQPSLSSLLGPGALAALLARQSATPQPPIPQSSAPVRSPSAAQRVFNVPVTVPSNSTPLPDPNSLLEKLRAAGLLHGGTPAMSTPTLPLNASAGDSLQGFASPFINTTPSAAKMQLGDVPDDLVLKASSLKL